MCVCLDPYAYLNTTSSTCLCMGSLKVVEGECGTPCRVCGCPGDQHVNSTSTQPFCACNDPLATLGIDGQCHCLKGLVSIGGLCLCPPNQSLDPTTGTSCLCTDRYASLVDGTCQCLTGFVRSNGVCGCPPGKYVGVGPLGEPQCLIKDPFAVPGMNGYITCKAGFQMMM